MQLKKSQRAGCGKKWTEGGRNQSVCYFPRGKIWTGEETDRYTGTLFSHVVSQITRAFYTCWCYVRGIYCLLTCIRDIGTISKEVVLLTVFLLTSEERPPLTVSKFFTLRAETFSEGIKFAGRQTGSHKNCLIVTNLYHVYQIPLTHCRLNKLAHTIYWKILILILGMSGYVI